MADIRSWGCLVLLGIFQIGLSDLLYSTAIKHVSGLGADICRRNPREMGLDRRRDCNHRGSDSFVDIDCFKNLQVNFSMNSIFSLDSIFLKM